MNANSSPQTPAIKDWIIIAARRLSEIGVSSGQLDAEIILAYSLQKDRTYLHSHPEQVINTPYLETADKNLKKRLERVPIAYITGRKEFYGREFIVNENVLIPRPESETIIEILKNIKLEPNSKLIDIGTGSGCLGITAKLEFPTFNVALADISSGALEMAQKNALKFDANIEIIQSDLLEKCHDKYDVIIANLPYVNPKWDRSPETEYEPQLALFADNDGKAVIEKLISQSVGSTNPNGYLIIEADPGQHEPLIEHATKHSFILINRQDYIIAFKRR
jgi:release factor glutamine methyltransferase